MDILNRIETLKNKLQLVKEDLSLLPQVDTPSVCPILQMEYILEKHLCQKGTFAIGKRHRFKVLNILKKVRNIGARSSEEVIHLKAPCIFESEAGVAK